MDLQWIETHAALAGWVQGLGTFAAASTALVAAVFAYRGAQAQAAAVVESQKVVADREVRALAAAFLGEIVALRGIVERREMLDRYKRQLDRLRRGDAVIPECYPAQSSYTVVWVSNAGRLGLLPAPLPERLAGLYVLITGVIDTMGSMYTKLLSGEEWSQDASTDIVAHLVDELETIMACSEHLIPALEAVAAGESVLPDC